jgi:hypothetical protein
VTDYRGSCQCGAVRFRFSTAEPVTSGMACNCSRCQRIGSVLAFVPRSAFTLEAGEGATTEYRFNRHAISHRFCATCGVQGFSFADGPDGTPMVAVNLNAVEGIDPRALKVQVWDGRAK